MPAVNNIRDASPAVAFNGDRQTHRPGVATARQHQARLDRDCISWSTEAFAFDDQVANRNAFDTPAEAQAEPANLWRGDCDTDSREILIRNRHNRLGSPPAPGLHAIGVARIEEV